MDGCKFIDKIGIELEAAWKEPKKNLVIDESFSPADFSPEFKGVGELVSHPIASKEEMLNWLQENWPDETCHKCAMHVHFSLNHINYYSACMSNRFYEHFLNEMDKWGKDYNCRNELFWQRLKGENRYCRKRFNPDIQVKYTEKGHNRQDRRDHWNFCYGLHKTMECRLLPMFKSIETAKSAIFALINCIEGYLNAYTPEEKHLCDELFDFDCENNTNNVNKEIYTAEHENRYQELSGAFSLTDNERLELNKLIILRKIGDANKKEKSKFKFNFFEIYDANVNANVNNVKFATKKQNIIRTETKRIIPQPILKKSIPLSPFEDYMYNDGSMNKYASNPLKSQSISNLKSFAAKFNDMIVNQEITLKPNVSSPHYYTGKIEEEETQF